MCGSCAPSPRPTNVEKVTDPTNDLYTGDSEWLMRAIAIYLSPDMPGPTIIALRDTSVQVFMDRIALEISAGCPTNEQFTPLILCLIGGYQCGSRSRAYDSSSSLTLGHEENRKLLRQVLKLPGQPYKRTAQTQTSLAMRVIKGRGVLECHVDKVPNELRLLTDFIEGIYDHVTEYF